MPTEMSLCFVRSNYKVGQQTEESGILSIVSIGQKAASI